MDNIYKSPDSEISKAPATAKLSKGHVFAIWTISILYLLFAANSLVTLGVVLNGTIDVSGSQYFGNLQPADYVVLFGIPFSEATAAILLLFRRKATKYFWFSALVLNLLGYLLAIIYRDWAHEITLMKVLGFSVRVVALVFIARYSVYLARLQMLK